MKIEQESIRRFWRIAGLFFIGICGAILFVFTLTVLASFIESLHSTFINIVFIVSLLSMFGAAFFLFIERVCESDNEWSGR